MQLACKRISKVCQKALQRAMSSMAVSGDNLGYVERMYEAWQKDPKSVHTSWNTYFLTQAGSTPKAAPVAGVAASKDISDHIKVLQLVNAFQLKGHEIAELDPLNLDATIAQYGTTKKKEPPMELNYKYYGFTEADLNREFHINVPDKAGIFAKKSKWRLSELIDELKKIYCGKSTLERSHIVKTDQINWLVNKMENSIEKDINDACKKVYFDELQWTSLFEEFLAKKFTTTKRFSASGSDGMMPCLQLIIDRAIELGVEKIIIGMPHRGRVNCLARVMKKSLEQLLAGFSGAVPKYDEAAWGTAGDVKYHLGYMREYTLPNGKKIEVQLMPNPSHLESIDPVSAGRTRAEQDYIGDKERKKVLAISIHGDAAFAGQGNVFETMQFADLNGYKCGGTIHIVVNNQIGFTTVPRDSRSGFYCTEIAKTVGAPIFHCNSEDPDAVIKVSRLVAEYRQKFSNDVVIDLVGYRLYGHNEMDQPMFTQPIMYRQIQAMKPIYDRITEKFIKEGFLKKETIDKQAEAIRKEFNDSFVKAKGFVFNWDDWKPKVTNRYTLPFEGLKNTGIEISKLKELNEKINTIPMNFAAHPLVRKVYDARKKSIQEGTGIDWATGEALAWATLLQEGHHVRISGQDVQRGTFSHRHSYLHSQELDKIYIPLRNISKNQGFFSAYNSSLSELAVLGFEIGYEYANPNSLVMWEGQFGDFANGGQIMIDTYISAGEAKWGIQSGIVVQLPHGYDGQGSEHSSARLERYLQLTDDDPYSCRLGDNLVRDTNWQVVNITTPANYFHVLRRQIRRDFRKPLISMNPKRMLRLREATSALEDFGPSKRFMQVIPEVNAKEINSPEKIEKLILCSGQVYYDLVKARKDAKKKNIAIVRVEQLAPFPVQEVQMELNKYPNARVVWAQEEHMNMGAWNFVQPRANKLLEHTNRSIKFVGRPSSAAPATGFPKVHEAELAALLKEAMA